MVRLLAMHINVTHLLCRQHFPSNNAWAHLLFILSLLFLRTLYGLEFLLESQKNPKKNRMQYLLWFLVGNLSSQFTSEKSQ